MIVTSYSDLLAAASGGGEAIVRAGTRILVPETLRLVKPLRLVGCGELVSGKKGMQLLRVESSGVTIAGLTLTGTGRAQSTFTEALIAASGTVGRYLEDLTIAGCTLRESGFYGVYMEFVRGFYLHQQNVITGCWYAGVLGNSVSDGYIFDNTISQIWGLPYGYGVALTKLDDLNEDLYPRSSNVIVRTNTIDDVLWEALDTHAGRRIWFDKNICTNVRSGVVAGRLRMCKLSARDVWTTGNWIQARQWAAPGQGWVGIDYDSLPEMEPITGAVTGNTLRGCGLAWSTSSGAIHVYGSDAVEVAYNTVMDPVCPYAILIYHHNRGARIHHNVALWSGGNPAGRVGVMVNSFPNTGLASANVAFGGLDQWILQHPDNDVRTGLTTQLAPAGI